MRRRQDSVCSCQRSQIGPDRACIGERDFGVVTVTAVEFMDRRSGPDPKIWIALVVSGLDEEANVVGLRLTGA